MANLEVTQFDSKTFNPRAFGAYLKTVPQLKKNEFLKAGILTGDSNVANAFSSQTGTFIATIPYYGLLDGEALNYDGQTTITATSTKTFHQNVVVTGRAKAWMEKDFSRDITGGVDFMDNIGNQVGEWIDALDQKTILAILEGVFGMTGGKDAQFVKDHTLDISGDGSVEDPGTVGATTLNNAIQKACGDNKGAFSLAIMHSVVATNLENLKLLNYAKYTDKDGLVRDLGIATWNGRTVLIDDSVPTTTLSPASVGNSTTGYVTYVFGKDAFIYENIGAKVPVEMARDPKTNGGEDTLYIRQRKVFAPRGISFTANTIATNSPSDEELKNKANWTLVNDGQGETINPRSIAIARIISRG